MRHPLALSLAAAALAAGGCGGDDAALSPLCVEGQSTIARALRAAPGRVALADGTRLSDCVAGARDTGDLESFGFIATRLADRLAGRAARDAAAAQQLGYLIGAARRGAAHSNGIHAELVRRLEATSRRLPDRAQGSLQRGLRAGATAG
jgi:hypothetical protein